MKGTILTLVVTIILGGAVVYLLQRLRKTDAEIDRLRKLTLQTLDVADVRKIATKEVTRCIGQISTKHRVQVAQPKATELRVGQPSITQDVALPRGDTPQNVEDPNNQPVAIHTNGDMSNTPVQSQRPSSPLSL